MQRCAVEVCHAIAPGPFSAAVDRFLYTVKGMGCHGSAPQTGLDPIPAAARLVGSLQEIVSRRISPTETAVISVTRFTSGTSWNIIPETARLEGTVRTFNPKVREQIVKLMQAQAEGLEQEGFEVLRHHMIPPNDGGIAIGQAAYGLYYLQNVKKEI